VKVKKRGVEGHLRTDFLIMQLLARLLARIPLLRDLRFDDSMDQFGVPLHQQLDFRSEAQNLERFASNFRCASASLGRQLRTMHQPKCTVASAACVLVIHM
jgi:predicted unusual protein kinase regulating ubiquinone biosynthesis (AarF/ABC1/UbiB family)